VGKDYREITTVLVAVPVGIGLTFQEKTRAVELLPKVVCH
jgi:hypothetical protein